MQVKSDRLWSDLMTLAQIGAGRAGGNDRMALTDADRDAKALFADVALDDDYLDFLTLPAYDLVQD